MKKVLNARKDTASAALTRYVVDPRPLCEGMPFLLTDAAHPRLVLKNGSHFIVLDQSGSIPACNTLGYGYYRFDTRHISQWEISIDDLPVLTLSANVAQGYAGTFLHSNVQTNQIPQQKVVIYREVVLRNLLWERIWLENFHHSPVAFELEIKFQSDFADMFEVRGLNRRERGQRMMPVAGSDGRSLFLAYRGLDDILLETIIEFFGVAPTSIRDGQVTFNVQLDPREKKEFELCVSTAWDGHIIPDNSEKLGYPEAKRRADQDYCLWRKQGPQISTDEEVFNLALDRSFQDLYILRQPTPRGYGLAAGIPWYCAIFGRDSAITGMQVMPFLPELCRESIEVLAAYQGCRQDPATAESPGRILHELRLGELARTKTVPHRPYYGTVDATQLWLLLFCEYIRWTGDLEFARKLWPNVRLAVDWLSRVSESGYIWYKDGTFGGLENQGWKDSYDSVMHADGSLARPPIAICEAQGYLYQARQELSDLADLIGQRALARRLKAEAASLKQSFRKDFWMEKERFVALALDSDGKQVASPASNPGHLLFSGILEDDQAHAVADRLMSDEFWSGWGIRTLSGMAAGFNPISYHNGSVWPHDNAIIAGGLRKLGRIDDLYRVMYTLYEVARVQPEFRLPELFCGFGRQDGTAPIDYPVSCSPQAWAAGSLLQVLKWCLNMQPDAVNHRLHVIEPALPEWMGTVTIRGLRVGEAVLDLSFSAAGETTSCQILKKSGPLRVLVEI